jgi:hypothetical protein
MPIVLVGEIRPDAPSVVKLPAAAAVPPIAGGDARYVENPEPLTVLLAERVVNAPVDAVVAPTLALLIAPPVMALLLEFELMPSVNVVRPVELETEIGLSV